jgi:mono/diheme cytochrome c family protein
MYRFVVVAAVVLTVMALGVYAQSTRTANPAGRASYSAEQAQRGKALYSTNCSTCHLENLKGNCPGEAVAPNSRYVCTGRGNAPPLVGDAFMQRWYSVGDLYARVRWSMPAGNVGGLSANDNLAIIAYLLQANGVAAGSELKDDVRTLKTLALRDKPAPAAKVREPLNELGISQAYYTEEQATRGKNYYYGACGMCHTADASGPNGLNMPHDSGLGWHWGNQWRYAVQGTDAWLTANSRIAGKPQMWDTVADLYNKVATTQPAYAVNALSDEEYTSIVAYLLKQAGFPSGNEPLTYNLNLMRNMTMEKGYERLFNGKDLTGWGFVVGANCPPKSDPDGCAQTKPGSTFIVRNGLIDDSGTPHGYMYPLKKYGPNFTFRAEYRYVPAPGATEDQDFYGNSGYLLFITKHDVWPRTLEIQGRTNQEMNINAMDGHAEFTWDDDLRKRIRRGAGEWNSVEIVSKGNEVSNYLNGTLLSHVTKHDFPESGWIGIQSESGAIQYRNMRIKPE